MQLKRTPFHERTAAASTAQNWRRWAGHIVLGSYELGLDREYWAIRNAAALIDVSPLLKYRIKGPDAAALLDRVTPRNIAKMAIGQVGYTGWCDEHGKMLDDGTITRIATDEFRLTAAEPQLWWLERNAVGMQVTIEDQSERVCALSLQGPKSRTVLNACCETTLDGLKYFRMMENRLGGCAVQISRTGYTGDLGFEIWLDPADAFKVWDTILAAGHDHGTVPCGILAMDMARVEAGLFMLDVDYTAAHAAWIESQKSSPLELGLDWAVHLDKPGYFIGREALEREAVNGPVWRMVGVEIDWVGMEKLFAEVGLPPQIPGSAVRGSLPIYASGRQVGYASTSTWSPVLKKYIALAHVERAFCEPGTEVAMEVTVEHKRKAAPARVVKLPFYEPEWKKA